ncbi:carotenoid oxygenase [Cladochytrium replicatum]|nr:carotenoid oxygenase [Cladochytrium replicatum]
MVPPSTEQLQRGWESQHVEHSYWVPSADIEGSIPAELQGTFFRNGPGLNEVYGMKLAHPIDGDGMLCALTFVDGKVHFRNRFVRTWQHHREQFDRAFEFQGQMGTREKGIVPFLQRSKALATMMLTGKAKVIPPFRDPSNTNVFYWGGKLLSCYETHLPHSIDPFTLDTLGPDDLNGTLQYHSFAAHARYDPVTDRLVTLSLKPEIPGVKLPVLQMNEYDSQWKLIRSKVVHVPGLNYAHDFVLTPNYYIIHKTPFVKMSKALFYKIALGLSSPGECMQYYPDMPSQFVIIPRETANPTWRLVDTDPMHIYHFGTAQEEDKGQILKFNAVCLGKKFNMKFDQQLWLANATVQPGNLQDFTIDLSKGVCSTTIVDRSNSEFPVTHPYRHGFPCRYTYIMATAGPDAPPLPYTNVLKYDSKGDNTVSWKSHGALGEPCFVPRNSIPSEDPAILGSLIKDEDDGWVIVQVYVPEHHRTDFVILDAQNMSGKPVAIIKLRHHVPYGFHGTFTPNVFLQPPPITAKL